MHHRTLSRFVLASFFAFALIATAEAKNPTPFEALPVASLEKLKKKPCAFVHVWATWCTICIQELPDALKVFGMWKDVTPVVIDVSSPFVQENFSKKWLKSLAPPFTTYLKPAGKDEAYLEAIDPDWSGALPYSMIFRNGKKKKAWIGGLDLPKLKAEIDGQCKD